jgi:hypothetical protein
MFIPFLFVKQNTKEHYHLSFCFSFSQGHEVTPQSIEAVLIKELVPFSRGAQRSENFFSEQAVDNLLIVGIT